MRLILALFLLASFALAAAAQTPLKPRHRFHRAHKALPTLPPGDLRAMRHFDPREIPQLPIRLPRR